LPCANRITSEARGHRREERVAELVAQGVLAFFADFPKFAMLKRERGAKEIVGWDDFRTF
jgi:hypothetical protein